MMYLRDSDHNQLYSNADEFLLLLLGLLEAIICSSCLT